MRYTVLRHKDCCWFLPVGEEEKEIPGPKVYKDSDLWVELSMRHPDVDRIIMYKLKRGEFFLRAPEE